jgi:plasmid stability protein
MATIYVRNIPPNIAKWIKEEAARQDQSVTGFVRSLLKDRYTLRPSRLTDGLDALPPSEFSSLTDD